MSRNGTRPTATTCRDCPATVPVRPAGPIPARCPACCHAHNTHRRGSLRHRAEDFRLPPGEVVAPRLRILQAHRTLADTLGIVPTDAAVAKRAGVSETFATRWLCAMARTGEIVRRGYDPGEHVRTCANCDRQTVHEWRGGQWCCINEDESEGE